MRDVECAGPPGRAVRVDSNRVTRAILVRAFERAFNGGLDPALAPPAELRWRRTTCLVGFSVFLPAFAALLTNPLIGAGEDNAVVTAMVVSLSAVLALHATGRAPRAAAQLMVVIAFVGTLLSTLDTGVRGNTWTFVMIVPVFAALLGRGFEGSIWGLIVAGALLVVDLRLGSPDPEKLVEAIAATLTVTLMVQVFRLNQRWFARALERSVVELEREVEERRAAQARAQEASRAKSDFLATMSHEIRTPLNGVVGASELLGLTELDPKQTELLQTVQTSSELLLTLINDVLHLSRLEARGVELESIPVQIASHIERVTAPLALKARSKGLKFELDVADDCPEWIYGDPTRLGQIVLNLVGNATKFTQRGTIRVALRSCGDRLSLSVEDSGIGIPKEAQSKLFQPFVQAERSTSRRFGGTGLGLSIVRHLVEAMDGRVHLRSEPKEGSTFEVVLPLRPAKAPESTRAAARAKAEGSLRVLVADDNAVNRMVVGRMLRTLGAAVATAENGLRAIERLEEQTFDLILMDVQMPELDGLEATQRLRERPRGRAVPVVGLSAGAQETDRTAALEAGMDDFLTKPIRLAELQDALARWSRQPA